MRKILSIVLVIFTLMTFISNASAQVITDDTVLYSTTYASEYKKVIENIINDFGVSVKSQYNDNNTNGFVYAELIDFDGDSTPELYTCYKKNAEKTSAKDVYVEAIFCYSNGKTFKIYEDSNDLTPDYCGTIYYTNNGKTYMLRENSAKFSSYNYSNEAELYHMDIQLKQFKNGSFEDVINVYSSDVYTKNQDFLTQKNYTEENSYFVDYFEVGGKFIYHASKYTVTENGVSKSVTKDHLDTNDVFEKYTGKRSSKESGYLTEHGKQYIHYTQYGTYPDKNLEYNAEGILNYLNQKHNFISPLVTVTLNGEKLAFDTNPVIYNSRTLVPLRIIFEALGAEISWDDSIKTVTAIKDGKTVKVPVNKNAIYINGEEIELDVAAKIVNSRTLVPVRAVTEAFSCTVSWDDATKTVIITN